MPHRRFGRHASALLGYAALATAFSWPLPLHLATALLGAPGGDLGVYIWNIWIFRHEILAGHQPFATSMILALTGNVPLALHNYTPAFNAVAFLLQPALGVVATFNVLTIASVTIAAYAMHVLASSITRDDAAAWVAGLTFGFSSFISARATEHPSLVQAAPLPLFALVFQRLWSSPSLAAGVAMGACLAWAFFSDPYYAVYCVLIACLIAASDVFAVSRGRWRPPAALRAGLLALALLVASVVVVLLARGGGRVEWLGLSISITSLHNPVLVLTVLVVALVMLHLRPVVRLRRTRVPVVPVLAGGAVASLLLLPLLAPALLAARQSQWVAPKTLWRSSAPGLDVAAFVLPNPLHPVWGSMSRRFFETSPNGFVENIASVPVTVLALTAMGLVVARRAVPTFWLLFTALFFSLSLGPFVRLLGQSTYVPTPWAILRYAPGVGAARMPTRFSILVFMGLSVIAACVVADLRRRSRRPGVLVACVCALILAESLAMPRPLHSARTPAFYRTIAEDARPVRVLNLPFGLRDGMSSYGDQWSHWQYHQSFHGKPLLGAYLSRLPQPDVEEYQRLPVTRTLMLLSEGTPVAPAEWKAGVESARSAKAFLNVGYVVVDTAENPAPALTFAQEAFDLQLEASEGRFALYRPRR